MGGWDACVWCKGSGGLTNQNTAEGNKAKLSKNALILLVVLLIIIEVHL